MSSLAALPDTSDNTTDLIEIDAISPASAADEPIEILELDMEPTEPEWLRDARVAAAGARSHGALNEVIRALRHLPEGQKIQIRPIIAAQRAEIERNELGARAPTPMPGRSVAVVAATAAVVTSAPDVAVADTAQITPPAAEGRPVVAGWRRIDAGPHAGTWGVRVEHLQHGVAIEPPAPGDVVLANRAKGGSQPKRITGIVRTDGAAGGYSICTVADPAPGERATPARPRGAAQPNPAHVAQPMTPTGRVQLSGAAVARLGWIRGSLKAADAAQLDTLVTTMPHAELRVWSERLVIMDRSDALAMTRARLNLAPGLHDVDFAALMPVLTGSSAATSDEPASSGLASLATVDADLAAELGGIAAEGAANASVADLGAQSSAASSAAGRRLGVGFSTPQQYVQALERGGLQPATRAEYLAHVRGAGIAIDESQLPPANAPSALPVGAGIAHTATGPSYFDQPRAARQGFKVGKGAQDVKTGAALLRMGDLIAGSIAGGAGGDFSWAGRGQITRAALLGVLAEIGREDDAPAAKDAHAQAGRAVAALRSLGYHVHAVQGTERKGLPAAVAHRYIVGSTLTGDSMPVIGAEYGRRVLVVDLHQDDTMHCTGDENLAAKVRADFEARCATDVYISADLTTWLQKTLRNVHGGTRFGVGWYVPAGHREAAERLTRAVAKIWGESFRHGMPVASSSHLFEGLSEGLSDEIVKLEEAWAGAQEKAREARRTEVTAATAGGLLTRLFEMSERVRGYAALLGDEAVAPLRARLATLDAAIRPLVDDTTARASMLEFS
jgi:hypothetical protein